MLRSHRGINNLNRRFRTGNLLIGLGYLLLLGTIAGFAFKTLRPADSRPPLPVALATSTPEPPPTATGTTEPTQPPASATATPPTVPSPAATPTQAVASITTPPPAIQAPIVPTREATAPAPPTATQEPDQIPEPTSTDTSEPADQASTGEPTRIRVPAAGIDTDVVTVGYQLIDIGGQTVIEWDVALWAAGHHSLSANPGEGGNVVIAGHVAGGGEVFRTLELAEIGDEVILSTPVRDYHYTITEVHLRLDVGVPLEERLATGEFMADMPEERLTLITCWPYGVYDHRLIVVAKPQGGF